MFGLPPKKFLTHKWLVVGIFFLAFVVRLYRINNPILDWHAFRQADTASVTREFVKSGWIFNPLIPHYQDLSNIQSGKDNLAGYRMVELPWPNALMAWFLLAAKSMSNLLFPQLEATLFETTLLELTSRLFSVIWSLIGWWAFWWFLTQLESFKKKKTYLPELALGIAAFLPYSVFYARTTLPEPTLLATSLLAISFFTSAVRQRKISHLAISYGWLILASLLKPTVIFLAPIFLALTYAYSAWKFWPIYFAIFSAVPLILWRQWILNFPSGIPASDWLLNGNGIRFRPAWFRWIFYERITKLMLGWVGGLLLAIGGITQLFKVLKDKRALIWLSWWLGILGFVAVIASGNVQHDYYQVPLIPIISWTVAAGSLWLFNFCRQKFTARFAMVVTSFCLISLLILSWTQVQGYFNVNHWEYVAAGRAVQRLTPPNSLVIAHAMGDTQFLFQTNRRGWPIGFEVEKKRQLGAQFYVTTSWDDEARELAELYRVIEQTSLYTIIDIRSPKE